MSLWKKFIDWVTMPYEPEFRPKRVYKIKGKTYYLRKRKRNASRKQTRR